MSFAAVILAAGVGSRLRPLTRDIPKCLAPLAVTPGAETILGRMVRLLVASGATTVVVSTGYMADAVRAALADAPVPVTAVHNPDYAVTQNVVSLHRALHAVPPGPVVKLDGDVVFSPAVLHRLLGAVMADHESAVAVDDRVPVRDEAMKVVAVGGTVQRFGKGLSPGRCAGESIGVERLGAGAVAVLRDALEAAVTAGRTDVYYEDVYNDLVDHGLVMRCVGVGDCGWTEVDDAADLTQARALVAAGL